MTPGLSRARTRWTAPGATVGVAALGAFLAAWIIGPPAVVFSAVLASVLLVAWGAAGRNLPPHVAEVALPDVVPWGEAFHGSVAVRAGDETRRVSRDVVFALGLREQTPRAFAVLPRLTSASVKVVRPTIRAFERGRCRRWTLILSTTWPFGLFERRIERTGPADLLVLPRVGRIRGFEMLLRRSERRHILRRRRSAGDEDLKALREWRPGESRRRIHWKVSARRGTTVLRELEEPTEVSIHLVFDTRVARGGRRGAAAFERAVRLAASLAESFRRTGREHAFTILDADGATPVPTRGGRGRRVALEVLAEVEPAAGEVRAALPVPARGRQALLVLVCAGRPKAGERVGEEVDLVLDVEDEEVLGWLRESCGWAEE